MIAKKSCNRRFIDDEKKVVLCLTNVNELNWYFGFMVSVLLNKLVENLDFSNLFEYKNE